MNRWQRYWFAPGGRHGAAVVRIAIAGAVLWTLARLTTRGYAATPEISPEQLYRATGVLLLLGKSAPPAWLIDALAPLAFVATLAMLVGFRARTATVISWISAVALASYQVSFTESWSHHNNLPFLAQLAFFGARGGDVWSVDAWLRRRRGEPPIDVAGGYQWSLRLVQLAVALMFFSAALSKLYFGGFTPAWAFSDNLRHQLLARYDWIGAPRTAVAEWLLADAWRYRAAAGLNLLAQLLPIVAAGLVRWPRLRALAGVVFAVEVLALGVVMDLWNLPWLPLVAVFVDWDAFFAWAQRRRSGAGAGAGSGAGSGSVPISVFIAAFLLYDVVVIAGLDQRLRTYPFSAYPMFGYVRAKRPYGEHQSYEMPGVAIEIVSAKPVSAEMQAWIDRHHTFRNFFKVRTVQQVSDAIKAITDAVNTRDPSLGATGARIHFAAFQAPAYPAPAELRRVPLGLLGEWRDNYVVTGLAKVTARGDELLIAPRWTGVVPRGVKYEVVIDYGVERVPLQILGEVRAANGAMHTRARKPAGGSLLVLAVIAGERYVIGEVGKRAW